MTPFTREQFLGVFATYNAAIWPMQIAAYGVGVGAVSLLWSRHRMATRVIVSSLALMWAMNGIGYHFLFFASINPIAKWFAAFFMLQSLLFVVAVRVPAEFRFEVRGNVRSVVGLSCIVYALLIYPVLGYWAGHGLMAGPMFGVAPCPTTIFTIGMLMLARGSWVVWLSIIPVLWSMVGLAAALQLGILEDLGLPVASIALCAVLSFQAFQGGRGGVTTAHAMRRNIAPGASRGADDT